MAIPTFVRVLPYGAGITDPVYGPTSGGALVYIYGGGFRLPLDPIGCAPGGNVVNTVEVLFGGAPAPVVQVPKSNLLHVVTPASPLAHDPTPGGSGVPIGSAGIVDLAIRNLDDDGVPIPGEEITVPSAYTYTVPRIGVTDSTLERVTTALQARIRRDVWPDVVISRSVEYDADGSEIRTMDLASIPALAMLGPTVRESRDYQTDGTTETQSPVTGLVALAAKPLVVDLVFQIVGIANERRTAMNLMHAVLDFVRRTPRISLLRNPLDPGSGIAEFQLMFDGTANFAVDQILNASDLHTFRGDVAIYGVPIAGSEVPGDAVEATVPEIETVVVAICEPD